MPADRAFPAPHLPRPRPQHPSGLLRALSRGGGGPGLLVGPGTWWSRVPSGWPQSWRGWGVSHVPRVAGTGWGAELDCLHCGSAGLAQRYLGAPKGTQRHPEAEKGRTPGAGREDPHTAVLRDSVSPPRALLCHRAPLGEMKACCSPTVPAPGRAPRPARPGLQCFRSMRCPLREHSSAHSPRPGSTGRQQGGRGPAGGRAVHPQRRLRPAGAAVSPTPQACAAGSPALCRGEINVVVKRRCVLLVDQLGLGSGLATCWLWPRRASSPASCV